MASLDQSIQQALPQAVETDEQKNPYICGSALSHAEEACACRCVRWCGLASGVQAAEK